MSEIQMELLKVTDLKVKKNEERQNLLHRLVDAVQDLDDSDWKELSTEAQKWVNEAASAIKKDGEDAELNEFPDLEEEAEEEEAEEAETSTDEDDEEESDVEEPEKAEKAPPKRKKPAKPEAKAEKNGKKAAPKAEKKAAEKKPAAGPKVTGIKVQIKKLVLKKPSISVDELIERLGKDGTKPSKLTVSAIRSEFRHSLFVLRDAGALKGDFDLG